MDFNQQWRPSLIAAALSLVLVGCGGSDSDDENSNVITNIAPSISSSASLTAIEDTEYTYQVTITDPDDSNDGTNISFSIENAPEGMAISNTGLISWIPLEGVLTSGSVTLTVQDGGEDGAKAASETFEVIVTPVNDSPVITSVAPAIATEDTLYSYQLVVTDPDDEVDEDNINFVLTDAPDEMTISPTGLISWIPTEGILSSGSVTISVTDGGEDNALAAIETFEVTVTAVNDAPTVSDISPQIVEAGVDFTYQINVVDTDDLDIETDISFELMSGPSSFSISDSGLISYTSQVAETAQTEISIKVSDGGEDGAEPVIVEFTLDEQFFFEISGSTINYFNGDSIIGSEINLSNGTDILQTVISNEDGVFTGKIQDIYLTDRLTLTADATGFSEAALSISNEEINQAHSLLLLPVHETITFDASAATELAVEGNLIVSLPENSLVDADGNLATSAIVAELTIINPAIDIEMMPGDMLTVDENGQVVPIESFGAITVSFVDESGNPLQLDEDKTAAIQIPVVGNNPPQTIPLYYFDDVSGLWIEEGEANLTTVNGEQFYAGNVSHFTTWNADRIYETISVHGCVEDDEGNVISNARIISDGRDYLGRSLSFSIEDGTFSIPVRMNSSVLIGATLGFQSRTSIINTAADDYTMPACLMLSEALTKITLNWGEAPRDLDSHLYITDTDGQQEHVFFANSSITIDGTVIHLDVDDTSSYGPEVISVPQFPIEGAYDYYVYNYTGTPEINPATTRVEFIFENQQNLFTPPTDGITRWWHVAKVEKDVAGELTFTAINEWVDAPETSAQANQAQAQRVLQAVPLKSINSVVKGLISSKYYDSQH